MSRSGYIEDDIDNWALIRWRGQVASATRGKRGQTFFKELVEALDALPEKRLITNELTHAGNVCAIGSLGLRRGIDMTKIDPEDPETVASIFDVAEQLAREVVYMNDELGPWDETPEHRWQRMRDWAASQIKDQSQ